MYNLHGPDRLYSTRYGHVLQYNGCDHVQITFRDHTLLVDEHELDALAKTIEHAWREVDEDADKEHWQLRAGSADGPVSITLTKPSLRSLSALLQGAWSMYVLQERVQAMTEDGTGTPEDVLRDHVPGAN